MALALKYWTLKKRYSDASGVQYSDPHCNVLPCLKKYNMAPTFYHDVKEKAYAPPSVPSHIPLSPIPKQFNLI